MRRASLRKITFGTIPGASGLSRYSPGERTINPQAYIGTHVSCRQPDGPSGWTAQQRPWLTNLAIDGLRLRASLSDMATTTRRVALYARVSTSDRSQTVENQLQPLQEAARRLGRTVVASTETRASVAPRVAREDLG